MYIYKIFCYIYTTSDLSLREPGMRSTGSWRPPPVTPSNSFLCSHSDFFTQADPRQWLNRDAEAWSSLDPSNGPSLLQGLPSAWPRLSQSSTAVWDPFYLQCWSLSSLIFFPLLSSDWGLFYLKECFSNLNVHIHWRSCWSAHLASADLEWGPESLCF